MGEDLRYTPEEAADEAAYLKGKIEAGEAKDYKEADEQTREWISNFVKMIREGKRIPADFSAGPSELYGSGYEKPFEGYKYGYCESMKDVDRWKQILNDEAFQYLVKKINEDRVEIPEDTRDENGEKLNPAEYDQLSIIYCGKTFQAPKQSEGYGRYHRWHEEGNAFFEMRGQANGYGYMDYYYQIALKMTEEEKEKYCRDLEKKYGNG